MEAGEQRKQFVVPTPDQLVNEIRGLDEDIEHVSLNLIKCNFEAVEKDVEKAFPAYKFVKVKKYKPGSFEVVFEVKIDAINFIRKEHGSRIMGRRFFIKLGRQNKETIDDWACVGFVPRNFKPIEYPKNPHPHRKESSDNHSPRYAQKKSGLQTKESKQNGDRSDKSPEAKPSVPAKTLGIQIPQLEQKHKKKVQKKKEEEAAENKPEETTKVEERTLAEIATKQEIVAKVDTVPPRTDTTKGEDTGKKPKKTDAVKTIVPETPVPTPAETLDDEGWIIVKPKGKKR